MDTTPDSRSTIANSTESTVSNVEGDQVDSCYSSSFLGLQSYDPTSTCSIEINLGQNDYKTNSFDPEVAEETKFTNEFVSEDVGYLSAPPNAELEQLIEPSIVDITLKEPSNITSLFQQDDEGDK